MTRTFSFKIITPAVIAGKSESCPEACHYGNLKT